MSSSFTTAEQMLASLDADWRQLIAQVGPCTLSAKQQSPYESLIRAIASQQLHGKAAEAILARLLTLYSAQFPSPQQLANASFEELRSCGFSSNKVLSMQAIAQASLAGEIPDLIQAKQMKDSELIQCLTQLRGVGQWTVEMMLIFNLGRMDVLPVDDYGVRMGYQRLKNLDQIRPKQLQIIGEQWAPYRTIAAWYLWRVPKNNA